MRTQDIDSKLELKYEDHQKIFDVVDKIEALAPSDANVFFKLEVVDDKFIGSLSIRSQALRVDIEGEHFDIENLLGVLNAGCKERIDEWKRNRKI